ncbi:hypothetical protein HMSSN139_56890 [Paenibacillus sp. HMSSN-139]|nr:hypothetical protein HMSSN139_56890 [Paenibacillus sp. HMSSN-139]
MTFFVRGHAINSRRSTFLRKHRDLPLLHVDDAGSKKGRGENKEKAFDFLPVKDIEEVVHEQLSPSRHQNEMILN